MQREEYLVYGIHEYWTIDPQRLEVTVLTREGEGPGASWSEQIARDEQIIPSRRLPGFAGTVTALWADVEPDSESETDAQGIA